MAQYHHAIPGAANHRQAPTIAQGDELTGKHIIDAEQEVAMRSTLGMEDPAVGTANEVCGSSIHAHAATHTHTVQAYDLDSRNQIMEEMKTIQSSIHNMRAGMWNRDAIASVGNQHLQPYVKERSNGNGPPLPGGAVLAELAPLTAGTPIPAPFPRDKDSLFALTSAQINILSVLMHNNFGIVAGDCDAVKKRKFTDAISY